MYTLRRFVGLTILFVLAVSACSGGASAPAATATPEGGLRRLSPEDTTPGGPGIDAAAPGTVPPCQRRELELWLQRSGSLVMEYAGEVNSSLATPPDQIGAVIERLGTLRSTLQDTTPPPCAVDHHDMITAMMLDAIDSLTAYAQGNNLDLVGFATRSNAALDQIRIREAQLAAIYDSLPRE